MSPEPLVSCAQAPMGSGDENDLGTEVKSLSHIPRPYPGVGGGGGAGSGSQLIQCIG